ncbi:MAG TPA: hypothetical protein VEL07_09160 [Planctomycetota bacterium]|nr:hypothetical protein [Planctomycetota bacterium]
MCLIDCLRAFALTLLLTASLSAATELGEAEGFVQSGFQAMQEAQAGSKSRIVDAALDFTKARSLFEELQRFDRVQEMNANIFWCKKQMNESDITAFVAQKPNDRELRKAVEMMTEVAEREVPIEEADEYFARAKAFAEENPDQLLAVTMRWFEVAERFAGTKVAIDAQKLSLASQDQYLKTEKAKQDAELAKREAGLEAQVEARVKDMRRQTLFSRPPSAGPGVVAMPTEAEVKRRAPEVKALFKDDSRAKKRDKRLLAEKAFAMAKDTRDDPVLRYALFAEAMSLASAAYEVALLVSMVDEVALHYGEGYSRLGEAQKYLSRIDGQEVAGAVLALLADPVDPAANTKAGKYWCLVANQWDLGLPMLANGDDEKLLKIANMEIESPDGAAQQAELGDSWYALAKTTSRPYKDLMFDRARHWYKRCQADITGASKDRVASRLSEIFAIRPDPDADYNDLTVEQWDALKGTVVVVEAVRNSNDARLTLKEGQRVRVVPHPTDEWFGDRWFGDGSDEQPAFTWKGEDRFARFGFGRDMEDEAPKEKEKEADPKKPAPRARQRGWDFNTMALVCWVGGNKGEGGTKKIPGIFTGPGKLWLGSAQPDDAASGKIRVKLIMLDDED